jgi:predicted transcriptional regulator
MVTLDLEPGIEARVKRLAEENHVSESFLIQEALLRWLEDREDYAIGIKALAAREEIVSQADLEQRSHVAG